MWNSLWVLFLSILLVASLNLTVPDPIISGVPTQIIWTTGDEDTEKWDLRLVVSTKDLGLAMANVDTHGEQFGTTKIRVNETGGFILVAVGPGPNFHQIGRSNFFNVERPHNSIPSEVVSTSGPSPSLTTGPTSTTSQASTLTSSVPTVIVAPVSAPIQSESLNTSLIVGVVIGGSTLVIGGITLFVIIQRRRRSTKARETFIFDRKFMFQRRPSTDHAWTPHSVDFEKGIRGSSPQIFVTTTTTRDTDY